MNFEADDFKDLERAKWLLENPGLAAKFTDFLGTPIEKGFEMLPQNWKHKVGQITHSALSKAVTTAVFTLNEDPYRQSSNLWHKLAVGTAGGISGFFGLAALALELPVSTTIMLRSIADIARSEGELISSIETRLACMEVFAFGGGVRNSVDDVYESAYFVARAALASSLANAAEYIAERGMIEGSPALLRFVIQISERFSVQVSEKAVSQALPIIGAAGGALINTLFIDHFQDMARGHFIIRRLERRYGADMVQSAYEILDPSIDALKNNL
ncbi:MAG: EcsC family protein [Desulfamplus sp.]|nr:EcsC family protein [Desulfamplus sp.]